MPPSPCQGDTDSIMAASLSPKTILTINHCQLTYHVFFCSDITNGWGDQISLFMCQIPVDTPNSTWKWLTESLPKADWLIWYTFL